MINNLQLKDGYYLRLSPIQTRIGKTTVGIRQVSTGRRSHLCPQPRICQGFLSLSLSLSSFSTHSFPFTFFIPPTTAALVKQESFKENPLLKWMEIEVYLRWFSHLKRSVRGSRMMAWNYLQPLSSTQTFLRTGVQPNLFMCRKLILANAMGGGTRREEEGRTGEPEPFPADLNLMRLARLMLLWWFSSTFGYVRVARRYRDREKLRFWLQIWPHFWFPNLWSTIPHYPYIRNLIREVLFIPCLMLCLPPILAGV